MNPINTGNTLFFAVNPIIHLPRLTINCQPLSGKYPFFPMEPVL